MERIWSLEESLIVATTPEAAYAAVADVRRMTRLGPEGAGVLGRVGNPAQAGERFFGLNRRGPFMWFTDCRVETSVPGRAFTFRVGALGLPIARWGYTFEAQGGETKITETWEDLRRSRVRGRVVDVLGAVVAGTPVSRRAALNRAGMRRTLHRLAALLEEEPAAVR
jgi:hypothetical protein